MRRVEPMELFRSSCLVVFCVILASCGGGFGDGDPNAPLEERLDLSSPEAAIGALRDAYADRDFVRAWFVFDKEAQRSLGRAVNNLNLQEIRRASLHSPQNLRRGSGEHHPWLFLELIARVFEDAARDGFLHVDFRDARVVEMHPALGDDSSQVALVELDGGSRVLVRLTLSAGRWRVNQVAMDGVELDRDGGVFLDGGCGEYRIEVHEGLECPGPAVSRHADLDPMTSDEVMCAVVQGERTLRGGPHPEFVRRAEQLMEELCPGDLDLVVSTVKGEIQWPDVVDSGDYSGSETVYTMLDLSSPEQSVATFVDLFEKRSFFSFQLVLAPEAQRVLARPAIDAEFDKVAQPQAALLQTEFDSLENSPMPSTLISEVLNRASDGGFHLVDMSGAGEAVGSTATTWTEDDVTVNARLVETDRAGSGSLYFLVLESPSGRWRIRHVSADPRAHELADAAERVFAP